MEISGYGMRHNTPNQTGFLSPMRRLLEADVVEVRILARFIRALTRDSQASAA